MRGRETWTATESSPRNESDPRPLPAATRTLRGCTGRGRGAKSIPLSTEWTISICAEALASRALLASPPELRAVFARRRRRGRVRWLRVRRDSGRRHDAALAIATIRSPPAMADHSFTSPAVTAASSRSNATRPIRRPMQITLAPLGIPARATVRPSSTRRSRSPRSVSDASATLVALPN